MRTLKFPAVLDNTMRSAYRRCPMYFFYTYIRGLQIKNAHPSIDLIAGAAFAKGLEAVRKAYYILGLSSQDAILAGIREMFLTYGDVEVPDDRRHKAPDRVLAAFESYWDRFPLAGDSISVAVISGKPAVEFSAVIELPFNNPDTGDPLLFSTRYDWIGIYGDNMLFGVDEKTCSQMGPKWANQWNTRAQFMGYTYAAHQYGIPVAGTLIRGVQLLLTKIHHAEAIIYTKPYLLERWWEQLKLDVARMIKDYEAGQWDLDFSDGCTAFWGCAFQKLCLAKDADPWVKAHFEEGPIWNPVEVR